MNAKKLSQLNSFVNKFKLPGRLKGGIIEKWVDYWINVKKDYTDTLIDIAVSAKSRPGKAFLYLSGLTGVCYAIHTNPDFDEFRDILQKNMNDSALISDKERSPSIDERFNYFLQCYNYGLIRRFSFGIGSILWVDNYPNECALFKAQCSYLKPSYLTFHHRIIDVGFLGKWRNLEKLFNNYDVNEIEWGEDGLPIKHNEIMDKNS